MFIGMTSGGNAVWINRIVAKADVKILMVSRVAEKVFYQLLRVRIRSTTIIGTNGWFNQNSDKLSGNPMHQDEMGAAHLANVDFIVNVVLNLGNRVVKAVAGDMTLAWLEGGENGEEIYMVEIQGLADIIIVLQEDLKKMLLSSNR